MEQNSTILIVDDQLHGRRFMAALLGEKNYNLVFAANGAEALAKAEEIAPDLILLDVVMPDMDGFEVCRRLRRNPRLSTIAIIMVTALGDRNSRLQGIEAGADDFVSKPVDGLELRARVKNVTLLNRYRRLLAEQTRLEWVVEHTEDGFVIINEHDAVLYTNPKARVYLDLPADQDSPVAETFTQLAAKHYHCEPQEAWAGWPTQPTQAVMRYLVRPESETTQALWLQVTTLDTPTDADGNKLLLLHDTTSKLTLAREMWKFHSIVFHKLRSPTTVMLSSIELLTDRSFSLTDDEREQVSEKALENMIRLRDQIESVLHYLTAPNLAQSNEGFKLSQLPTLVAEQGATLEVSPIMVSVAETLTDTLIPLAPQALEVVLREILENAKKFHPAGTPTIEVSVSPLTADRLSLRVSDDGQTLSPKQLAQVWVPYYQGEKYFTGKLEGMGLGLSKVALMVWGVGGECHMHNRSPEPGVMVELILPIAKSSA